MVEGAAPRTRAQTQHFRQVTDAASGRNDLPFRVVPAPGTFPDAAAVVALTPVNAVVNLIPGGVDRMPPVPSGYSRAQFPSFGVFDAPVAPDSERWQFHALMRSPWYARSQAPMSFRINQLAGGGVGALNPFLEDAQVRGLQNLSIFSETRQFFQRALRPNAAILKTWSIIHDPQHVDELEVAALAVVIPADDLPLQTYVEDLILFLGQIIAVDAETGGGKWTVAINSRWKDPQGVFHNGTRLAKPIQVGQRRAQNQIVRQLERVLRDENDSVLNSWGNMQQANQSGWVWVSVNWVTVTKVAIGTAFGVPLVANVFPFPAFAAHDDPLPRFIGFTPGAWHMSLPGPWETRRAPSSPFLNTLNFDPYCFRYAVTAALSGNHTVHPNKFSQEDFACVTWPVGFPFPTPLDNTLMDALEAANRGHRFSIFVLDPIDSKQKGTTKKAAWNFRHVSHGDQEWCDTVSANEEGPPTQDHWLAFHQARKLPENRGDSLIPVASSHWMLIVNKRLFLNQITRGRPAGAKISCVSGYAEACDVCLQVFYSVKAYEHHSFTCRGGTRIVLPAPNKNGRPPLLCAKPDHGAPPYFAAFDFETYDQPTVPVVKGDAEEGDGPVMTVVSNQIPSAFSLRVMETVTGKCVFREDYPYLHPVSGEAILYTHHEYGVNEDYDFDKEDPKYRVAKRLIRAALCARGRMQRQLRQGKPPDKKSDAWLLQCYSHGGCRYDSLIVLKAAAVAETVNISVLPRNGTSMLQIRIGKVVFLGFENFLHASLAAGVDSMNLRKARQGEAILEFQQRRLQMAAVTFREFKDEIAARDKHTPDSGWANVFAKGIFPYDLCHDASFFERDCFPPLAAFVGKLSKEPPSQEVYDLNKSIFVTECRSDMLTFMMRYCVLDTTLLCDLINYFRHNARRDFDVEMLRYLTSPSMYWDASLKRIPVRGLELITDETMYLFWRRAIVGGFAGRLGDVDCISNFPELENMGRSFDPQKPRCLQMMLDMNSMYATALAHTAMPYKGFIMLPGELLSLEGWLRVIRDYTTDGEDGYLLEVDVTCPVAVQDTLVDMIPLLPGHHVTRREDLEARQRGRDMVKSNDTSKLVVHFFDKVRACHHVLQLHHAVCDYGYVVTKVHRVCKFKQKLLYTDYVNANIARRKVAKSDLQSSECKAGNNFVYGFSIKNPEHANGIEVVVGEKRLQAAVRRTSYRHVEAIGDNVYLVTQRREKIRYQEALYIGATVLAAAKVSLMVQLEKLRQRLKEVPFELTMSVNYSDTDSALVKVSGTNASLAMWTDFCVADLRHKEGPVLDLSSYPEGFGGLCHEEQFTNKGTLGLMKNEYPTHKLIASDGVVTHVLDAIYRSTILCAKSYFLEMTFGTDVRRNKGVPHSVVQNELDQDAYLAAASDTPVVRYADFFRMGTAKDLTKQIVHINKKALGTHDTKCYYVPEEERVYPFGYHRHRLAGVTYTMSPKPEKKQPGFVLPQFTHVRFKGVSVGVWG